MGENKNAFGENFVSPAFPLHSIKNILVVQTAFLGDVVLTIPLINTLKRLCPDKKITVLTTPVGNEILKYQQAVDSVIVYDKKGTDRGWTHFLKMIDTVRCMFFDWAIVPHRSLRSALLVHAAGIPHRWGFDTSAGRWLFTQTIAYPQHKHEVERNLAFLKPFTDVYDTQIVFPFHRAIDTPIHQHLQSIAGENGTVIGVHPGSVWATKRWPIEKYAVLIQQLAAQGNVVLVFGDTHDHAINKYLNEHVKQNEHIINLIGKTTIQQLIAYLRYLSVYITNDSGPMHIAAALGIPVVAIFGPTTQSLGFAPYSDRAIVVEKNTIPCRPCGKHGPRCCPQRHFACMEAIKVEDVVKAVESINL